MTDVLRPDWKALPSGGHEWTVPDGWGQGRACFGGLVVASMFSLSKQVCSRPLRTIQANFLAPVRPGSALADLTVLRDGRSTTVTEVRLRQEDRVAATAILTFVEPRTHSRSVEGEAAPSWSEPDPKRLMPYIEGLTPEFTQHFEYHFAEGGFPYSGQKEAHIGGFIRFRDREETDTEAQIALLDAWPCPTITVLDGFAPSSTVTWTIHLLEAITPGYARFRYRSVHARDGFSTSVGTMWRSDGRMVAYSEQTVAVFDGASD
ncbi:MAG: thioesterase family protein [Myxococcota bacterium]